MKLFGRIGRRLLGWFLLIALIPLLFMGYQGYASARRGVEREVYLHLQAVAMSKRHAIEQWFAERAADMRVVAASPLFLTYGGALHGRGDHRGLHEISQMLNAYQVQSRSYAHMCLYDRQGMPLLCTMPGGDYIASFERSTLFRKALNSTEPVPGPIYLNPATGPTMHLAQTIRDPRGEPLGVVVATLVLAKTLNPIILDSTGLGQTGEAYLVDAGKVMLTPSRFMDHPDPLTHTMDTEGIRRALTGSDGTGGYKGYDGRRVIGAWTYMPEHEWALIVEMKAEEALAPLARMRRDTILVAMLTFGVILMVVGLISRSISAPIRELAAASLDVSRGDLERTVTVRLRDELGELAERFNAMVGSLKDSRSALQDAYDKLVRAQKQIVQAERLAAVGELAASVVHEIRNPLSAVKMNLRILEGKCAQDSVAAEHFRLAREQTERLETMLEDLLDFSKPVALRLAAVRVEDVVEDALRMFRADDAMHTVTVNVSDSLPPLNADRERLGQVLLNLLLNARQASAAGEEIRVAAESVSENGASAIRISVADRGQGIAPENLSHVFEPFFTTRKRGTGLGLANARKIVEIHGGTISIESTVGKGTAVFVTLPIAS